MNDPDFNTIIHLIKHNNSSLDGPQADIMNAPLWRMLIRAGRGIEAISLLASENLLADMQLDIAEHRARFGKPN